MMRDFKLTRKNSSKNINVDDIENIPVNHNRIEEQEVGVNACKVEKTPIKATKSRYWDAGTPLKTPDKRGGTTGNRFGWAQKNESISAVSDVGVDMNHYRNTPRSTKAVIRGTSIKSECNSTQCTPTKSVTKPSNQGLCMTVGHRPPPPNGGARMPNFAALSRGIPSSGSLTTVVNTVEVPHFEMKEDPSFWLDHNVQVLIRVRPLNNMEKSTQGYNRCLKQESSQSITWIGQPETRFTFDHVACESVDQETLFRMVGLPMVENCLSGYNSCMFAYGQTGSGKTYTMLGDIDALEVKPSPSRGMTPRIFEFLFARIRAEEESRRDERLAYNCKCSFLEIYNEHITDLLDPSSTNLQLREDTKTGVYVENLSEFEVETVADILKLLSQGSSNRRVAATNMNRGSSRSHSVFTCVIESRWEKDSTSNLRFARLNLVDLAGSERQKSSGAEGERLKETANINKSLSTLGHVIMVLVDVAHAKTRHVPYRDSRLTFLLQDSLGGNSKTMIIANVSPSICSAAETLNTLKFAQRAKLIQNNAVVNEDSSGDVAALQHQIRILKEELLALKRQNVSRSLSFGPTIVGSAADGNGMHRTDDTLESESRSSVRIFTKQEPILELPSLDEQLYESVQQKNEEMQEALVKQTEEILDIQLELDILKIILKEERSSRGELEEKEICLMKDLQMAESNVSLLTKLYEDAMKELTEAKSVIDALENQQLLSISEMEDVRNSNTRYVELVRQQELENFTLKQQGFRKELKNLASSKFSKDKDSPLQVKLKKMHDSLDNARRLNLCYQSDLASHASNEEEMDEVRRQVEAETAEVIVCLHDELGILQQQFLDSALKDEEAEARLMHMQTEFNKLQEDNEALTQNNKSLCEKLADKDNQLNKLSEEWETFLSEIETALAGGHEALNEALNEASDQLDGISGSFLQRKTWISEQLSKMTKSISEKDLLDEELNCCLKEANNRTNDLERLLMSLRGATLAITEEHQQIYTEKEKEIILLTSELSDKMVTIAELENKIKYGENELRKASRCGTVAFVIVSRLSEINSDYLDALEHKDIQLTELKGSHMQKDLLLLNQAVKVEEAEKYITSLSVELEVAKEASGILTEQLYKEKKCVTGINFLETREKLSQLKHGISTVKSCLTIAEVDGPQKDNAAADTVCSPSDNKSEGPTGTGENQINKPEKYAIPVTETDTLKCPSKVSKNLQNISSDQYSLAAGGTVTDAAVALLRAEIESALEILQRVPIEMAKLCKENKELCDSKKRTQQVMEMVMSQLHSLQASVSNFEDQVGPKMSSLDHKLLRIENTVKDTVASLFQKNESFEHEVTDSKILAVQRTAEVSCILAKFEEAQDTIREADYMVNELMMANKSKKAKIERLKKEKIVSTNEVQRLESSNKQKDLCVAKLEEQSESDFIAIKGLVQELEGIVSQAQFTCNENFESLHSDFVCLKSQVSDSTKLVHSWIEEIWSEIILKDCALSVLHLCHMGILLETVTGLNAENGLLHHGLCESNSLIYNLRQHNCKSKRELEMCRVLEGKLLADIKNNFDRISRKEDETAMLSFKLSSFEEKILDLQQREEIMLQRSNYMGSELTMLMTELDRSKRNVMTSLLDRENLLKDKVDILEHQEEEFFVDLSAKDFHLLVLASELKQQAAQKAKLEGEQIHYAAGLDRLKSDMAHFDEA